MSKWIQVAIWLVLAPRLSVAGETHVAPVVQSHSMPEKVAICIGCHGIPDYRIAFPHTYRVPALAGQNAQYIETALRQYKSGQRKMPTMQAIAESLSEQDIAEIAAYYAGAGKGKNVLHAVVRRSSPTR